METAVTPTLPQGGQALAIHLPFAPSSEQKEALDALYRFVQQDCPDRAFILTGQAGTGKTSLIPALLTYLSELAINFALCAPTGRAAQVIGSKSNRSAGTIHSLIYQPDLNPDTYVIRLNLRKNPNIVPTVYIVDEASMLPTEADPSGELFQADNDLLSDLLAYIRSGNPHNKLILVGDPYQLPPVIGSKTAPKALDKTFLETTHGLPTVKVELTQIHRQLDSSPILSFATEIRKAMQGLPSQRVYFPGITYSYSSDWLKGYVSDLKVGGPSLATIVAATNSMVSIHNKNVRKLLWGSMQNDEPRVGDVVVVDNNWFGKTSMVASGTGGIITAINYSEMQYLEQLRFVPATIDFGYGSQKRTISTLIMLEPFLRDDGKLNRAEVNTIYRHAMQSNAVFRQSRFPADDRFVGSMRLRYGYALSCHKAQGGEWKHVYVCPYHNPDRLSWIYTAVTRAAEKVFTYHIRSKQQPANTWKTGKVLADVSQIIRQYDM